MEYEDKGHYCLVPIGEQFSWRNAADTAMACYGAIDKGHTILVFDMRECNFVDSSGIARLADLHKRVTGRKGKVGFLGPSANIRSFMSISGLNSFVEVFATEADIKVSS